MANRLKPTRGLVLAMLVAGASPATAGAPTGIFIWYPDQATAPSSAGCEALVQRVRPSREKAEAWLWGRAPFGSEMEYYLFVSDNRMEPTYAAEGDYDTGALRLGQTIGDTTAFELTPDDHPAVTIAGSITAPAGSAVVTVTLRDVPTTNGRSNRTTYFCRFDDAGTET
ncbi:hypothetical protein [Mesorhizobium australicum]|nr:hypothetical protein [Mesorhizobium australicum]